MHLSFMKLLPNIAIIWLLVLLLKTISPYFFAQKSFCPLMRSFFWKKSSHTLEGSTMYTDYFETIVHNYNKISILIPNNFV